MPYERVSQIKMILILTVHPGKILTMIDPGELQLQMTINTLDLTLELTVMWENETKI